MADLTDAQIEAFLPRMMETFVHTVRATGADPYEAAKLFADVLAGGVDQGFIRPIESYSDEDKKLHPFFVDMGGSFHAIVRPDKAHA